MWGNPGPFRGLRSEERTQGVNFSSAHAVPQGTRGGGEKGRDGGRELSPKFEPAQDMMRETVPIRINEPADQAESEETEPHTESAEATPASPLDTTGLRARRALAPALARRAPGPLPSAGVRAPAAVPKQAVHAQAHSPAGGPLAPKGTAEKPRGSPTMAAQLQARAQAARAARTEAEREMMNREARAQAHAAMVAREEAETETESAAGAEGAAERSPRTSDRSSDTATLTLDPSTFVQVLPGNSLLHTSIDDISATDRYLCNSLGSHM